MRFLTKLVLSNLFIETVKTLKNINYINFLAKPKLKKGLDAKYRLVESSKNQELNVEVDGATFPEPKGTWWVTFFI